MKKFTAPEMEVSKFNLSDVLTTSEGGLQPITETEYALENDNGVNYVSGSAY